MKKTKMLKKNYEYKIVLTKGKYYTGDIIEAFIKDHKQKNQNFLGIAISSKVAKATRRNFIKRRIRESYKNMEDQLNTGKFIIFLWKKKADIEKANYQKIENDMRKILIKAGVLIEEKS